MRFGIFSPPVSGHIHPFGALGRELIERGHQVTLLHVPDIATRAKAEGLDFAPIGQNEYPIGSLAESLRKLGQLDGMAALRFTIRAVRDGTEMICREGPAAVRQAGIEFLLVDQSEAGGATVADYLGLPFITICNALALNREADIPPPFTSWPYRPSAWSRLRNEIGYAIGDRMLASIAAVLVKYRKLWGLSSYQDPQESFSKLAQISQQAEAFDFPRRELPQSFHYAGPLRKPSGKVIPFPWDKLDGRPLIYASLGTLQNGKERVFRCFAEACLGLDAQLVITHGGGLDESTAQSFPGNPVVVSYAPQLDVLARATLTLTHAGLNTVLDSLTYGVPLVAVPITYEQPAIAQRIRWTGAGKTLSFAKLNAADLRAAIQEVLDNPSYAANARRIAKSIREAGGVRRAADIIEQVASIPNHSSANARA